MSEAKHDAAQASQDPPIDALAMANLPFAEDLYFQFLRDPASVDPSWRRVFEHLDGAGRNGSAVAVSTNGLNGNHNGNGHARTPSVAALVPPASFQHSIFAATSNAFAPSPPGAIQSRTSVRLLAERVQRLVEAYRELGHLSVDLDPLGLVKRTGPQLKLEDYGLSEEDLDLVFSSENVAGPDRNTLRDLVELLRETYSRKLGIELAHLHEVELRSWLQGAHGEHP